MRTPVRLDRGLLLGLALLALAGCDGGIYVRGIVRDANGQPVPGARVRLERGEGGRNFERTTEASGCFFLGGVVAPGSYDYDLRVEAPGFQPAAGKARTLEENRRIVTLEAEGSGQKSRIEKTAEEIVCPDVLAGLEDCRLEEPAIPEDWQTVADETRRVGLRLPPGFRPVPAAKGAVFQDGQVWEDGNRRVTVFLGNRGPKSFEELRGRRCLTRSDAYPMLLVDGTGEAHPAVLAWIPNEEGPYDIRVQASSGDPRDRELLLTIAQNAERLARVIP